MPQQPTIGFIGTGKMGRPMKANVLSAGYPVVAFNRSPSSLEHVVAGGATGATSIAEVAQTADVILTSLTNQQSVRDVFLGDNGLAAHARQDQILIATSTNDVALMREIAAALESRGAAFLDAPVSGGVPGAEAGSLTVMVGGEEAVYNRALPVLEVIGGNIHHLGPVGAGTAVKLVNQLLVGIHTAAVAEALVFGASAGAAPQKILDVISSSFGGSRMLDRGVPLIINRNFTPATPVDLIRKDLGIVLDSAHESGLNLSIAEAAIALFNRTSAEGMGGNDMTAVVIPLENDAGFQVS